MLERQYVLMAPRLDAMSADTGKGDPKTPMLAGMKRREVSLALRRLNACTVPQAERDATPPSPSLCCITAHILRNEFRDGSAISMGYPRVQFGGNEPKHTPAMCASIYFLSRFSHLTYHQRMRIGGLTVEAIFVDDGRASDQPIRTEA